MPSYVPRIAPEQSRPNALRTRTVMDGAQLLLRDPPLRDVTAAEVHRDNAIVLQETLRDSPSITHFAIPDGVYDFYGNVHITRYVHIEGRTIKGPSPTTLQFGPGFGVLSSAKGATYKRIGFEGNRAYLHALPAGGTVITPVTYKTAARDDDLPRDVFHGCLVAATHNSFWEECKFSLAAGTGHALIGSLVGDINGYTYTLKRNNVDKSATIRCLANKNSGHGFFVGSGENTNACVWMQCDAVGNEGWAFWDHGFLGNHFYACHASGNLGGSFAIDASGAKSTMIGGYSEGAPAAPPSHAGRGAVVVGGVLGGGFNEEHMTGLLLGTSNHVTPHRVFHKREVPGSDTPVTGGMRLLLHQLSVEEIQLLHFKSNSGLNHIARWRKQRDQGGRRHIDRIEFHNAEVSGQVQHGMEWCQGDERAPGAMVFPGGFAWRRDSRSYDTERRVVPWAGFRPTTGVYAKGDLIVDIGEDNLFYRPRSRFGIGPAWRSRSAYRLGDVVTVDEAAYVAVHLNVTDDNLHDSTQAMSGATFGDPDPATGIVLDGDIEWLHWGPSQPDVEVFGRKSFTTVVPLDRRADASTDEPTRRLLAGGTWRNEAALRRVGTRVGDAVTATPHAELPDGVIWSAVVYSPGKLRLKVTNAGSTPQAVDDLVWTFAIWANGAT